MAKKTKKKMNSNAKGIEKNEKKISIKNNKHTVFIDGKHDNGKRNTQFCLNLFQR